MSKKKDKKNKADSAANPVDYKAEVKRLRKENQELRLKLEKIGRLAQELPEAEVLVNPDLLNEETVDVDHGNGNVLVAKS